MKKAFDEGWGGVIAKTVSLDSSKVVNVTPRYAKMRGTSDHKEVRPTQRPALLRAAPSPKTEAWCLRTDCL